MLCDLHTHSCLSDGVDSPEELVAHAVAAGLGAVALCDHNTVRGLARFVKAAENTPVTAVRGVEISCEYTGKEVHILGLFLSASALESLDSHFEQVNRRKRDANMQLTAALQADGFDIDYAQVEALAGGMPNRLHFAKVLQTKGYVQNTKEAFATLLQKNGKYYIPPAREDAFAAIERLRTVGAVPVLAHPLLDLSEAELADFLPAAKPCGLVGMECLYSVFTPEQTEAAHCLARQFGLLVSGGSDYHGSNKDGIALGTGRGDLQVPMSVYENLRKQIIYTDTL